MLLKSINPTSGDVIREYPEHQWDEVDSIIKNVHIAYKDWKATKLIDRIEKVNNLAKILEIKKEGLAFTISLEMGKPIKESRAEIEKCIDLCNYYCTNIDSFLKRQYVQTAAAESFVSFQPLGVVLAIMPWNFPFWQVFRFAIPALLAGNTVILKHASNVPGCSISIEDCFVDAAFPDDVFRAVLVSNRKVERMVANKKISAITLTGSTRAGQAVAETSAKYLKKCVLELGGSDPYLIFDDANIDVAVEACAKGRLINTGQSCIGAKRFIITQNIYSEFEERFVDRMKSVKMGDPFDEKNEIGPMARQNIREDLLSQVKKSVSKGANLLCGGEYNDMPGCFFSPTVLSNARHGMPAYDQELFGPVASLFKVKNEQEAIELANDTSFGLGAAIFSSDIEKAKYIAENELETGCCFVNDFVRSDPRLPFGGVKESGYGRELSVFGLHEFVNIKTIYIK